MRLIKTINLMVLCKEITSVSTVGTKPNSREILMKEMFDTFEAFNTEQRRPHYGPPLSRGAQMMSALCLWIIVKMKVPFFIKIGPLLLKQFDWFKEYRLEFGVILKVIKFDFISRGIFVLNNFLIYFLLVIEKASCCCLVYSEIF